MKVNKYDSYKMVKYIDGVARYKIKCVGFCNNCIHRGFLTKELLKNHQCIQRKCTFFDGLDTDPYLLSEKKKMQIKEEKKKSINEMKKRNKINEKKIIDFVNEILPKKTKIVLCKHLYDSTFILITNSLNFNKNMDLSKKVYSELNLYVYIKNIPKRLINNIEYTYVSFLPENMKERLRRYKRER